MRRSTKRYILVIICLLATFGLLKETIQFLPAVARNGHQPIQFLPKMVREGHEYISIFDDNCTKDTFACVNLSLVNTPICVHDDDLLSEGLKRNGIWEESLVKTFIHLLKADSAVNFVDIGANIGMYSIVAARFGRQVVAVDPWFINLCRFKRALILGNLYENVTLLLNGISHERGMAKIQEIRGNKGAQPIHAVDSAEVDGSHDYMKTILLTDILKFIVKFKSVIFKFDIEGHEWYLLEGIRAIIDICNVTVFMFETHSRHPLYSEMCPRLYEMMASKRYVPYIDPIAKIESKTCERQEHIFGVKQF